MYVCYMCHSYTRACAYVHMIMHERKVRSLLITGPLSLKPLPLVVFHQWYTVCIRKFWILCTTDTSTYQWYRIQIFVLS